MIDLREYLLIDYDFVTEFMSLFKESLYGVIFLFFVIALLFEMVNNGDILGVIKRVFLCIFVITVFSTVHHFAVDKAFDIANEIANNLSGNTTLLKGLNASLNDAFDKRGDLVKTSSAWVWIKYNILLGSVVGNTTASIFVFLAKLILILVKAIYTVVHNIGYGLIAIPSVFCIFSQFKGSLSTAMKTTAWCVTMPFVVLFLLMILSWQITHSVVHPMDHMAVTLGFLIMLLMSGGFAFGLLSGAGVMGVAAIGGMVLSSQMISLANKPISLLGRIASKKGVPSTGDGIVTKFKNMGVSGVQNLKNKISPLVRKNRANLSPDKRVANILSDGINFDSKYPQNEIKTAKRSQAKETINSTENETVQKSRENITSDSKSSHQRDSTSKEQVNLDKKSTTNQTSTSELQNREIKSQKKVSSSVSNAQQINNKITTARQSERVSTGSKREVDRETVREKLTFAKRKLESERFRSRLGKLNRKSDLDQ